MLWVTPEEKARDQGEGAGAHSFIECSSGGNSRYDGFNSLAIRAESGVESWQNGTESG